MIIKTAAEVKGLKRLHDEVIEAGEEYCFPLPRWLGKNWDEQMYSTAIAENRIEKTRSNICAIHYDDRFGKNDRKFTIATGLA